MKNIYIAVGNPCSSQNGSVIWPYLVSTAQQFDAIFTSHREPTTFRLAPGTYETQGSWAFSTVKYALLAPNCRLIGSGSGCTTLKLSADHIVPAGPHAGQAIGAVICGGYGSTGSNQAEVSGLTIDCTAAVNHATIGVLLYSGNSLIEDVRVIGIHGDWATRNEGFALLVNDSGEARNGGNVIRNCRVECDVSDYSYVTGIYLGSVTAGKAPNLIENCYVGAEVDVTKARYHASFACNENTTVRNCVGTGFARFLFCDTSNVGDVEITGCRGEFGYCAVDLPAQFHQPNAIKYRRRIRITNCTFENSRPTVDHAIAFLAQDQSEDHNLIALEDFDMDGCRWSSTLPEGKFYAVSIQGALTKGVWIRNSIFPAGTQTTGGVYAPTPSSEVQFSNMGGCSADDEQVGNPA